MCALWKTCNKLIVYKSGQKQARAPARKSQRGSCGRQPSLASLTQRMRVAGSEAR